MYWFNPKNFEGVVLHYFLIQEPQNIVLWLNIKVKLFRSKIRQDWRFLIVSAAPSTGGTTETMRTKPDFSVQ